MIKKIKTKLFFLISKALVNWHRLRGVKIGKHCVLSGFPRFTMVKGSSIILNDKVTLHSSSRANTILSQPMVLKTVAPGACIELKENCGLSGSRIVCSTKVTIGRYTVIGPDTLIYDRKIHEYQPECGWFSCRKPSGKPITIGDYCYIGTRCIILKGVTIGDNCVVSAGSVVTRDIPAGHLAQGNPATFTPLPARLGGAGE